MTQNKEEIYDKEIFPLMEQIIKICDKHGIPMFADFEYAPEDHCYTMRPDENGKTSIGFQMTYWAAQCKGNGDRLILTMLRHHQEHESGSVYLRILDERFAKPTKTEG